MHFSFIFPALAENPSTSNSSSTVNLPSTTPFAQDKTGNAAIDKYLKTDLIDRGKNNKLYQRMLVSSKGFREFCSKRLLMQFIKYDSLFGTGPSS